MGVRVVVGLMGKKGIKLLDFTGVRMREAGVPLETAIREAARVRLRPILMTTLCTLFGLLPLALGIGAGSDLQRPLALAVIGGGTRAPPIPPLSGPVPLLPLPGGSHLGAAPPRCARWGDRAAAR